MNDPERQPLPDRDSDRDSDRFGWFAAAIGTVTLVAVLVFTLPALSRWLDTLLVMVSLFAPAIVAGLVYAKIEARGGWDRSRRLR